MDTKKPSSSALIFRLSRMSRGAVATAILFPLAAIFFALAAISFALWGAGDASAQVDLDYYQMLAMDRVAFQMLPVALMPVTNEPGQILMYGDRYGYLRAVQITGDNSIEIWRSRILDGSPREVLVEDLNGDGRVEIIVRTTNGRLYVYDDNFNERWKNLQEDYREISSMVIANMDDDPAYEIVILAGPSPAATFLAYIDGEQFVRQFQSTQSYAATEMLVGNVDSDSNLEIVMNSGWVIDAVRAEPQWQTETFGQIIELLDIDGDGIEEILAYNLWEPMRVFDADQQQEKPLQ